VARFDPKALKRIVIKLGSSSIVQPGGMVRLGFLGKLTTTVAQLQRRGVGVALVSSGAIAMGAMRLADGKRPERVQDKQACAAVGQTELMTLYQKLFSALQMQIGQVLLTRDDLEDRRRYLNARETLLRLLGLGIVPIINENDSVSVEEIQFGDNDFLSALVAGLIDADLLILLTDVAGLYDGDPQRNPGAKIVAAIDGPLDEWLKLAGDEAGAVGSGGMRSKLAAADLCRQYGIPCVIAQSKGSVLDAVLRGETVGTYAEPLPSRAGLRARWLGKAAAVQGALTVDEGAREALARGGKSLLPKGVVKIDGPFPRGAVVALRGPDGREIGRGIARYGSEEIAAVLGKRGDEIETVLGFTFGDEIVHRDDFVLNK
jgi:glutamate 5-kinase